MKTLIDNSICFNSSRNISIENANFDLLRGENISFKYKYLENTIENEGVISLMLPLLENSLIKDFIISEINIKLSEFVEEKNDIFVTNSKLEISESENTDFDATQFFTKL